MYEKPHFAAVWETRCRMPDTLRQDGGETAGENSLPQECDPAHASAQEAPRKADPASDGAETHHLRSDTRTRAVVDTTAMDWSPSPSPSVWRKRLELSGPAEAGRVTSIVRYDPGSRFPAHPHPDGEEILVLDGVFSDESGDYPKGSYLLNPEGFSHAPSSDAGCVLFVKLRQYPGHDRPHVALQTEEMAWEPRAIPGVSVKRLWSAPDTTEDIRLIRFAPGTKLPAHDHPAGEEVFVLDGTYSDAEGSYGPGTWIRYPPGSRHAPSSTDGCVAYVKSGHLAER